MVWKSHYSTVSVTHILPWQWCTVSVTHTLPWQWCTVSVTHILPWQWCTVSVTHTLPWQWCTYSKCHTYPTLAMVYSKCHTYPTLAMMSMISILTAGPSTVAVHTSTCSCCTLDSNATCCCGVWFFKFRDLPFMGDWNTLATAEHSSCIHGHKTNTWSGLWNTCCERILSVQSENAKDLWGYSSSKNWTSFIVISQAYQ